ncbi:TIGR02147 family protein [Bdellovibrio svalbardensis]|uniref:TIGR02147 family protein n=1 Tax=Bdellovibrio svalbardensis TaxID=2972972 RepID=A0ABT6DPQ8_9BACT|nr:TIGR02147 family protein [Bdellovibrio svalbardensis]MDG0817128.1 TIGR02147 family protein [Bdellovibrio svalbardensis]
MSVSIFHYQDYKQFYNAWVENQPREGFGEYRRLAQALGVSTTMVSQVFKGEKHLSLELASEMCDYLRLEDDETDFFLLLVDYCRAGSFKLQKRFLRQIKARQDKSKKLENRVKTNELSEEARNVFYSSWLYSGMRLLVDTGKYNDVEALASYLNLPRNHVQKILDFLLANNLLVEDKHRLKLGTARTHVGSSSPLVNRHHQNWRIQAMGKIQQNKDEDFFYTGPMVLSQEVADWIRQELPAFVERLNAKLIPSPSEVVRCLNIDWFEY